MAEQFYTILTAIGKAKIANASALGNKVNFTTLKVGDGGGKYYNPTEAQEDLINTVWQGNINSISTDEKNPNWIVIEVIIPSNMGGFMIREAGIFDNENNMIAIGKYPETYKPIASDGSTKDLIIKMILEVSNTSSVTLKVDPTVIIATKKDIEVLEQKISDITKYDRKTYEELKALKDNNKLTPGKKYILTDYRTKYIQPDTNVIKEMEVEELMLTASSNNSFGSIVYSLKFLNDIVYYNFNNALCEDGATYRNGFITRRHDTYTGINCPQDWRTMLWARYKPDEAQYYNGEELTNYSVWTSGPAEQNVIYKDLNSLYVAKNNHTPNSPTDTTVFIKIYDDINTGLLIDDRTMVLRRYHDSSLGTVDDLMLKKGVLQEQLTISKNAISTTNIFIDNPEVNVLHNNVISYGCHQIDIGKNCFRNTIGAYCHSIKIGSNSDTNLFLGNDCAISMQHKCSRNIVHIHNNGHKMSSLCCGNTIGPLAISNEFGNGCDNNIFDIYASYNVLHGSSCSNWFGFNASYNTINANGRCNVFNNSSIGNEIGSYSSFIKFGDSSRHNHIGKAYRVTFGKDCINNVINKAENVIFGNTCWNNVVENECINTTFGDRMLNIVIREINNKDLSGITNLQARSSAITIQRNDYSTLKYVYWYINESNQMVVTAIP